MSTKQKTVAGEILLGGGGEENILPADSGWAKDWLTGGAAILDSEQRVLEMNESLRNWLVPRIQEEVNGADFWRLLFLAESSWKAPISEALVKPGAFHRVELRSEFLGPECWFSLEVARHAQAGFVQLNSILPSRSELEEGPYPESFRASGAGAQAFVRLLRAEGQLENLVRRWPGVIFTQRADLTFQFVSPRMEELTGVSVEEWKRLPQRFWEVVHEADAEHVEQQLRISAQNGESVTGVYRIRHLKTRRVAYVLEHREAVRTKKGLLLGYEGVWLDVTRQTIAEKRLSTAAWKETLSVLTMGLAHDFSNIMAGIHSLSESFLAQVEPDHPFREGLALIKGSSIQASQLIHRILHLHHGKVGNRQYQNLTELVGEIVELVKKMIPRHVRVETVYAAESLPVYVDAVEFRQVLINLALNALDAMPQGGVLRFRTLRAEVYPPLMHVQGVLPVVPSVCVVTEDEGCGIPAKQLASIFDPFFTTKSPDKGSGLGLYNARLFAEKHHGAISVDSVEGKGTAVRVWLPEADFTESERSRNELQEVTKRRSLLLYGQAGSALDRTAEALRENGFFVLIATTVDSAAELLHRSDYTFSAVLLLASGGDASYTLVADTVRRTRLPIKVVVEIAGCNQDELASELLKEADLVLGPDLPRAENIARIKALFADSG